MAVVIKPFICKVCNWSGPFPNHTFIKKDQWTEVAIYLCPDCNNEVRELK